MPTYHTPAQVIEAITGEHVVTIDEIRTMPTSTGKTRPALALLAAWAAPASEHPFDSVLGNPPFRHKLGPREFPSP